MKLLAQSIHPIALQGKKDAGDVFEINKYSERHHIVDGIKVPVKYFAAPFEIYEGPEIIKHPKFFRVCSVCQKRNNQQRFYITGTEDIICYECATSKFSENCLCYACHNVGELTVFDGRKFCSSCMKSYVWKCKKCSEPFICIKNQVFTDGGLANSAICMKCGPGQCKICEGQLLKENTNNICSAHTVKPYQSGKVNFSNRLVGIEIEMINNRTSPINNYIPRNWRRVHDGSLNENGVEFISPPFSGDEDLVKQLSAIECGFEKSCSYVDESCGLHVHVDTRDFTHEQLFNLYHVCHSIEDWVYSIVIPSRKQSKFSEPLDFNIESTLQDTIYGSYLLDKSVIKRDKYQCPRYKWANFHSVFYRGTIEFRCHHAVTSAEKIYNWAYFCQALVDYSKNHEPVSDGLKILNAMSAKHVFIDYFRQRIEEMR